MRVPNHIAIILDGNGRWAKKRGMPRSFGHVKGCENLEDICEVAKELGVKYLTVYAFSTENWKRSKEEVDGLMKLFRNYLKKCIKISQKNNMRVKVIGDITAFDSDIQESIEKLEDFSKDFTDLHFQIALNYGSRDEITRAVNRMLEDQKAATDYHTDFHTFLNKNFYLLCDLSYGCFVKSGMLFASQCFSA